MKLQQSIVFTGTRVHAVQCCSQNCENTFSNVCWELIFMKRECSPTEFPHTNWVYAIKYHFLKKPVRLVSAKKATQQVVRLLQFVSCAHCPLDFDLRALWNYVILV